MSRVDGFTIIYSAIDLEDVARAMFSWTEPGGPEADGIDRKQCLLKLGGLQLYAGFAALVQLRSAIK